MAKKVILGTDIARDAFKTKANDNFTELYNKDASLEGQINTLDANKANKTPPTWLNLTLQNGWGVSSQPKYRKNEFGELQLQGRITGGTTTGGTILFTLPEGYRVIGSRTVTTTTYTPSSTKNLLLNFASNGEVSIFNGNTADSIITLENITISL